MSLYKKTISGIRWTTLGTTLKFALQVAQVLILARWLEGGEMGLYSILLVAIGVSQFFSDMGISQALIHFQHLSQQQLSTLYWLNLLAGGAVCLLLFLAAIPIAWFYESQELVPLIQMTAFVFLIKPIGQQFQFLFQKELQFKKLAITEVFAEVAGLLGIILFLISGKGIFSVVYGILIKAGIYASLFFIQGMKTYRPKFNYFNINSCRECLRFGFFLMGERILNYISINLDKIIFGKFFGMEFLGAYELAHQLLIRPISFLGTIASKITFPLYSKIQEDITKLNSWYLKQVQIFTFLIFPVYFGLLVTAEETVLLLFGGGWEHSIEIFLILGWLGIFWSIDNPMGAYLQALGRTDYGFYANVYQFLVYFILLLVGVQFFNWQGVLILFIIGSRVLIIPQNYYFRFRLTNMKVSSHFNVWVRNFALAGIMFVLVVLFKNVIAGFDFNYLIVLSLCAIFGVLIYAILIFLFNSEPIQFLEKVFKK